MILTFYLHRLPLAEHAISKNYEVFVASNALPKTKTPGVTFLKFEINSLGRNYNKF